MRPPFSPSQSTSCTCSGSPFFQPGHAGVDALAQQPGHGEVAAHAAIGRALTGRRAEHEGEEVVELSAGEPGPAVRPRVDPRDRVPEALHIDDLGERLALGEARRGGRFAGRRPFQVLPSEVDQVPYQRLLGLVVLR